MILMDQICPISCNNWETKRHTDTLIFQNSFGMAKNVKIPIENFSFFQWCASNRAILVSASRKNKIPMASYKMFRPGCWVLSVYIGIFSERTKVLHYARAEKFKGALLLMIHNLSATRAQPLLSATHLSATCLILTKHLPYFLISTPYRIERPFLHE